MTQRRSPYITSSDRTLQKRPSFWLLGSLAVAALAAAAGCQGVLGEGTPSDGTLEDQIKANDTADNPYVAPTTFDCDETATQKDTPWRRLNLLQYENTLTDLLTHGLGNRSDALGVVASLNSIIGTLPAEERKKVPEDLHGSYRRLDQAVSQAHVDNWYEAAVKAGELLSTGKHMATLLGDCATDDSTENDASCIEDFVRDFGARALRRPLSEEEVAFYEGFYGDTATIDPAAFADLVGGLLTAPQFLYVIEHGSDEGLGGPQQFMLSNFELASRLSYHFWDTMPDDELWNAAASGTLASDATFTAQVDRLAADPRATEAARRFFEEWLKLEELPELDELNGQPVYDAFTGEDRPSGNLREAMIAEAVDLVVHQTFESGSFSDLFTTTLGYPGTEELANIYASPVAMAGPVDLGPNRPGLLTRAAFLATGTAITRPIHKGVFLRTNMLCDRIPPPPDNAAASAPELSDTQSTREVVEVLTEEPGTPCAGCHTTLINPLGFPLEGYDSLGRFRNEQQLFDDQGESIGTAKLDLTSVPQVLQGDKTPVDGASELMSLVTESKKLEACFARHYFRYSFGRWESVVKDGCALEQLRTTLAETGSIEAMLREVALSDAFRSRNFDIPVATAE